MTLTPNRCSPITRARPRIQPAAAKPRTRTRAAIAGVASYLPERIVTSAQIEEMINAASPDFTCPPGLVQKLTGVTTRRYKEPWQDASDLAVEASRVALERSGYDVADIDLVIFASSSQDLIEPATAHIVSAKLGTTRAMVMDVKNACNSFINAMQVADALMQAGQYRTVLVCTGECPSMAVRFGIRDEAHLKRSFAGYTFGDAGAAVVLEPRGDGTGLQHIDFVADSSHWEICTVKAGGTMHLREEDHTYFAGDGNSLRDAFLQLDPSIIVNMFEKTRTTFDSYDVLLVHQVTGPFLQLFIDFMGVDPSRIVNTIDELGNIASATMPLQLDRALADGRVGPGSRVLMLGLGAGISAGVVTMRL